MVMSPGGARPLAILREPVPLRLWFAGLLINVMRWLELLAFGLLALHITGSPFWVAAMTFARLTPLLFAAFLTALVEHLPRRLVLVCLLAGLAAIDLGLLLAALFGMIGIGPLLLGAALGGVCWTLENPIRRTMMVEAAGFERINGAVGLDAATSQLTRALGPALGGLLIETLGASGVFALGVMLHGLAFVVVASIPVIRMAARKAPPFWSNLKEGVLYARRHRLLTGVLVVTVIFNICAFPYVALAPVIGERVLELSPFGIGLLLAAEGTGGLCGALLASVARTDHAAPIFTGGAALFTIGTMTFGFTGVPALAFVVLFCAGFGIAGFSTMQMTIPLLAAPPEMRIRVLGLVTVCIGMAPIGFLQAGLLAEWLGAAMAQRVIGIESVCALFCSVLAWPELLRPGTPAPTAPSPTEAE